MDKTIQELIQERHVPEILFSEKYGKIDTVEDWETKRKPELKKIILEEEYGYPPDIKPLTHGTRSEIYGGQSQANNL